MTNIVDSLVVPYFFANLTTNTGNVTGDGTVYTCVFNTLVNGLSSWYSTSTGIFTATVPGMYIFNASVDIGTINTQTLSTFKLVTTNKTFTFAEFTPSAIKSPGNSCGLTFGIVAVNMNLNDTAFITIQVSGGTKDIIFNRSASSPSFFSGRRIS